MGEKIEITSNSYLSLLIAGEVSKDISRRRLIPTHIVQAHDEGVIHWHDMDCVKRFRETQVA